MDAWRNKCKKGTTVDTTSLVTLTEAQRDTWVRTNIYVDPVDEVAFLLNEDEHCFVTPMHTTTYTLNLYEGKAAINFFLEDDSALVRSLWTSKHSQDNMFYLSA